jgi:hypothetical protein
MSKLQPKCNFKLLKYVLELQKYTLKLKNMHEFKAKQKNSSEPSLPLWVRNLSHPRGEIAQRRLFRKSQFAQKLSFTKN